jgi:hypothetical protein
MKKRRTRGRPKLPWEYWDDLAKYHWLEGMWLPGKPPKRLADLRDPRGPMGLSAACRMIMQDGPLRWVRDSKTIAEISDWKTLRVRIIQAMRRDPVPPWALPKTTELWHGDKPLRLRKHDWRLLYNK